MSNEKGLNALFIGYVNYKTEINDSLQQFEGFAEMKMRDWKSYYIVNKSYNYALNTSINTWYVFPEYYESLPLRDALRSVTVPLRKRCGRGAQREAHISNFFIKLHSNILQCLKRQTNDVLNLISFGDCDLTRK